MFRTIFFLLNFLNIVIQLRGDKSCSFADCNHEGECHLDEDNKKVCSCIGQNYFEGPDCSQRIDICQRENPCKNNANCHAMVGQFVCLNCPGGYGGLHCDLEIPNIFENLILYFNHYGYYGKAHKFLIMVEKLGENAFSLELASNQYAIDGWETEPKKKTKWFYSNNLPSIIKKYGIRYHQDLPYVKGFYHLSTQTFWDLAELQLQLRSYDSDTGSKLFYKQEFQLLIVHESGKCVPSLKFIHGSNPLDPLKVDIAAYNSFEILLQKRCFAKSRIEYQWRVFDSFGLVKLHDFGFTTNTIFKVPPYKLSFNYHGEVISLYRLVVHMIEEFNGQKINTQARCFILVLPKPIFAIIKGGRSREIGVKQDLILDASSSRDYALAPTVQQDMFFRWGCSSQEDPGNKYCKENVASTPILKIKRGQLKIQTTYNFKVLINSKVNKYVFAEGYQTVKVTEDDQLLIDIQCLRNCQRNQYVKGDLMHLKAISVSNELTKNALYKWTYNEQAIGEEDHLVYSTADFVGEIKIDVSVEDGQRQGKCMLQFKENLPPKDGKCTVTPVSGEAFKTNFHIKCENYQDLDVPLSYEYLTANGFPLQRTNDMDILVKLPKTSELEIKICDQFEACLKEKVKVGVKDMGKPQNLKKVLRNKEEGLKTLLLKGDVLTAMVLLKSLTPYIDDKAQVKVIIEEMKNFNLVTLLQVEQFLEITSKLVEHLLPLDWLKAGVFKGLLEKLHLGFEKIIRDKEIWCFSQTGYEKSSKDLMEMMNLFGQTWQDIPPVQSEPVPMVLAAEPLKEEYQSLPDFDVKIVLQLENWLQCADLLENCFENLAVGGQTLYRPLEYVYELQKENFYLKAYGFSYPLHQVIDLKNDFVSIILNTSLINELKSELRTQNILIHSAVFKNQLFWWYPSATPINSPVFQLLILPGFQKPSKPLKFFKNPFEFELKTNNEAQQAKALIPGVIKNHLHMPLYSLEMDANAMLIVTFVSTDNPLNILVKFEQIPTSLEVLNDNNEVKISNEHQDYIFINPYNAKVKAYLAILLTKPAVNSHYTFSIERRECLYWDFTLKDPAWSSQGCKPKVLLPLTENMTCHCHHLSTFAAKTYAGSIQENIKAYELLEYVPLNGCLLLFYLSLLLLFCLLLYINFLYYQNHIEFLPHKLNPNETENMEIHVLTGSRFNAGTTANITLKLISQKGFPFSLHIIQDPFKPFLQKSSLCKLRLSVTGLDMPSKLSISNDQNGRYPNWYCHKVIIINLQTSETQTFLINRWIIQQSEEMLPLSLEKLKFREYFLSHLSRFYINWFQFQPLWGCWYYQDLNRLERCCISLSQFMACVCLVACYFGPTTMETYELERIKYYNFDFDFLELFLLSVICFVLSFIIKLLFLFSFWLLSIFIVKQKATDKKLL